jgi:protein subunit release factor B
MIAVGYGIALLDDEPVETFLRASGPGGQNVNKVWSYCTTKAEERSWIERDGGNA